MSKQFGITCIFFILLLVIYSLLRVGFFFSNQEFFVDVPTSEIVWAFVYGIRFDIAALLLLNLPILILFNLPGNIIRFRWHRITVLIMFFVLNFLGFLLNIADYKYFPTIQRRLLFEPYTNMSEHLVFASGLFTRFLPLTIVLLITTFVLIFVTIKLYKWLDKRFKQKGKWIRESVSFTILIILTVIGIRGGLQLKPLRQTNAFFSSHKVIGYLTLNSAYTVIRSLFQPMLPEYHLLSEDVAFSTITDMLKKNDEEMIDREYPFMRRSNLNGESKKYNVVLFIMESWTAQYCGSISGEKSSTPFFDSLAAHGLLFTRFIANAQRSIESVPSILTSIPGLFDDSVIGSKAEMNTYRGLGSILMEQGYTTSFHHGASIGSMGFDAFSRIAGFMNYYGKENYPFISDSVYDGAWGICDEPFFLDAYNRINKLRQPFCSVIFSLSSHDPYTIPTHRKKLFDRYSDENEFERSIRYADFSLQQFFTEAQKSPWFKNTIFIITADHTEFGTRNKFYHTYHIPLLFYAPGIISPQKNNHVGSQVDILPTILDLLHISTIHSSMGTSLLDSTKSNYAIVKYGPHFGIFSDKFLFVSKLENDVELYEYDKPLPECNSNIAAGHTDIVIDLRKKMYAYLQCVTQAIAKDRIYKK